MKNLALQLDEVSRRRFLARTAQTCFGVSIAGSAGSWFGTAEAQEIIKNAKGKAKHVIYLYMSGGMTHIDTFDPKPDAPTEYRGPVKAISTKVDGIQLGHCLEKTAAHTDKMAIIRSMNSTQGAHAQGKYLIHTGYTLRSSIVHPSLGSWANRLDPPDPKQTLPAFVTVQTGNGYPGAGFFEPTLAPLPIGDASAGLQNSHRSGNVSEKAFNRQIALRSQLDDDFSAHFSKGQKNVRAYNDMFEGAVRLMESKDLEAFDLSKESPATHSAYGTEKFAKGVLLARRLVENGVRFVEVEYGGFDWHNSNFESMEAMIPVLDQAYAALLHDLETKGLLDSTLVVIATEFGRSPKIAGEGGRNHFPKAFSFVLAGGGIRGGQVYGKTDKTAENVIENKVTAEDFNATIAKAMGLSYDQVVMSPSRRPFKMGGEKGRPIDKLFS